MMTKEKRANLREKFVGLWPSQDTYDNSLIIDFLDALDVADAELLSEEKLSRVQHDRADAAEKRAEQAERDVDLLQGQRSMTIDRLGGMVEGRRTHELNFLQRIDELVRIERRAKGETDPPKEGK